MENFKDSSQLLDIDLTPFVDTKSSDNVDEFDQNFYYTLRKVWKDYYNWINDLKPPTSKQIKDLWKTWYDPDFDLEIWYEDFERKESDSSYYHKLSDHGQEQWDLFITFLQEYGEDSHEYMAFAEFITKFVYVGELLNITDLDPFKLTSVSIEDKDNLPPSSGIYFVIDQDKIYYIGMSQNLRNRWYDHHRQEDFDAYPNLKISYLDSLPVHYLKSIETTFIQHFKPLLNIQENPLFK